MNRGEARQGSSWALQGCLVGSVGLFIVLLLVMLFLAFARFREHTATPDDELTSRTLSVPSSTISLPTGPIGESYLSMRTDA